MTTALLIIDVQRALCSGQYQCQPTFTADRARSTPRRTCARRGRRAGQQSSMRKRTARWPTVPRAGNWPKDWQRPPAICGYAARLPSVYQTELRKLLPSEDFEQLVICGLQTDYAANATVRQAHQRLHVVLVSDGHSTLDNGNMSAEDIIAEHNKDLAHSWTGSRARIDVKPAAEIRF